MKLEKVFNRSFFILIFLISTGSQVMAQNPTTLFWEPDLSLKFSTESRWSYSFGIANRTQFFANVDGERVEGRNQEHLELNQFTKYKTGANTAVSLGFRYRFTEVFNPESYDEFRIIQQFDYSGPEAFLNLGHRFRLEQRFRNVLTILRSRYAISVSQPLGNEFELGFATEALYSIADNMKPELDQRFSVELANSSFEDVEISLGFEYQYENYLNAPENELFIQSGISIDM